MLDKRWLLSLLMLLTGCNYLTGENGYFRDRQGDYLKAPIEPDMQVPPNLDSYTLDPLYVIPVMVEPPTDEFASRVPRPQPLDTNRPEGVVIQRVSGEAWIVIAATPQQVWPRVRDYWTGGGTVLDYENPQAGIMETGWLDNATDPTRLERIRVRIEPGLRAGSSEIYVLHLDRFRTEPPPALVTWPEASLSEGRGYEILEQISQYLADRTDIYSSSSASLLAGNLAGDSKATFKTGANGGQVLDIRIGYARAWAQMAQALERAGISVLNSDRDAGEVRVAYSGAGDEAQRPGFFGRLLGRGNDDGGDLPQFILHLEETATGVRITARPQDEGDDSIRLADQLLQTLLSNLG
ncbi:MAG: hypothetical protein RLZZ385_1913 [Pseudomonadota bacterium]|jgi:outer membrane protein assembly factor BamC